MILNQDVDTRPTNLGGFQDGGRKGQDAFLLLYQSPTICYASFYMSRPSTLNIPLNSILDIKGSTLGPDIPY